MTELTRRSTGGLTGVIALLLALCLMAAGVMPAYADEPPAMPHQFYGTVRLDGNPVQQGTLVEAFVNDVKQAETTVDAQGRYGYNPIFRVPGTAGATVTFHIGGTTADEEATWESGRVQQLNLTIHGGAQPPVQYQLTISSTIGGSVTIPGEEVFSYYAGTQVDLLAEAATGYGFVNWTANPTGTFGDAGAAETIFIMPSQDVAITAHFALVYELDMAADPTAGGDAIDVDSEGAYVAGATVSIRAEPASGYGFVNWTADAAVTFQDDSAEETTFTMPAQAVTITAHFGVAYNLTMAAANPAGSGDAIDVAGKGAYAAGATVRIAAVANPGYSFGNWTADAPITFGGVTDAETTFTMLAQAATVTAHFVEALPPPDVPTVTTLAATDISSYAATIHMSYTVGYYTPVEVRFACKRPTDPTWFYTSWVSRTGDGDYTEVLSGLVSQTQYQFKAQLRYDSTVIEGDIYQFTTAAGSSTSLTDMLAYFGCFIATAAYGTPAAQQIDVLRAFRDAVLLKSTSGFIFVTLYYRLSPPVADFIAGSEVVRTLVRDLLVDPIVWLVEATGDTWQN